MSLSEQFTCPTISHFPSLSDEAAERALSLLLLEGVLHDSNLESRVARVARHFRSYVDGCPVSCWAPGLAVTDEMRRITETYIPYSEVKGAFIRLCKKGLIGEHPPPPLLEMIDSWLDLMNLLPLQCSGIDLSSMMSGLVKDQNLRKRILFALYLPARYGGTFGRYPKQTSFLRKWLHGYGTVRLPQVRILDAACGSGEGVYELAGLCLKSGFKTEKISVTGVTISPLEIFSAAYASFPHAGHRESEFRRFVQPLHESGAVSGIRFVASDILTWESDEKYHVIICNGILGGPMIHDRSDVARWIGRLAGKLCPGGILLAANKFHGGWQKTFPSMEIERLFHQHGLKSVDVGEGIAGTLLK